MFNFKEKEINKIKYDFIFYKNQKEIEDKYQNQRMNQLEDQLKYIQLQLDQHKKTIEEIYNVFNKMNEYTNRYDYVVTDLKENMNNSFKDIEKAKEFIEKLKEKNIPYKLNNKLHKHLMRGK